MTEHHAVTKVQCYIASLPLQPNVLYATPYYWFSNAASSYRVRICAFLSIGNRGFSIGIGDVTPGKALIKEKESLVDNGSVRAVLYNVVLLWLLLLIFKFVGFVVVVDFRFVVIDCWVCC